MSTPEPTPAGDDRKPPYRPDAIALRETKGDRIGWVFSEPPGPRPSWQPVVGNAGAMTARCWLDEDGYHVWMAHTCERGERVVTMLPWPTWQVVQYEQVMPSVSCDGCGFHQHLRINAEFVAQSPATEMLVSARSDPDFDARRAAIRTPHSAPSCLCLLRGGDRLACDRSQTAGCGCQCHYPRSSTAKNAPSERSDDA